MELYNIRTDLAIETQEGMKKESESIHGVRLHEEKISEDSLISTVFIDTENASRYMGRPKGVYITLEDNGMLSDEKCHEVHTQVSKIIRRLLHISKDGTNCYDKKILVVGLGNRQVTPDSLGPRVVDRLLMTRHLMKEYGEEVFENQKVCHVSGIAPGVMAQTGMESVEIIQGIARQTKPDYVITIDALAARNIRRLGKTIQFTNTGITPGSGIGNHRNAINSQSVGVPVISLGVPTVVDAATIVYDAMNEEHRRVDPYLNGMFVTSKEIDEDIRRLSGIIAEGINEAFVGKAENVVSSY